MHHYPNFVEIALLNKNNKELLQKIKSATILLFESIELDFFKSNERIVRIYQEPDSNSVYIFDQAEQTLSIFVKKIHEFQKERPLEDLLEYVLKSCERGQKIYEPLVLRLTINTKELTKRNNLKKTNDEIIEEAKRSKGAAFANLVKLAVKQIGVSADILFNEMEPLEEEVSPNLISVLDYLDLLVERGCLKKYSKEEFKNFNKPINKLVQPKLETIISEIIGMRSVCEKNNFSSKEKCFEFNDLDNHIWLKDGKLVQTDQNCGFYLDWETDKDFSIYFFYKEYSDSEEEIVKLEKELNTHTDDDLLFKRTVLKVEQGQVLFANGLLLWVYELDAMCGYRDMCEKGYC